MTEEWLIDSGATSHMTHSKELLYHYCKFETPEKVNLSDGHVVEAYGRGDIWINMKFKVNKQKSCVMKNVLYVPKLACNLFYVRAAVSKGNLVKFGGASCWIRSREGKLVGMGLLLNKLYKLNYEPVVQQSASIASEKNNSADLWHRGLAAANKRNCL